ncbi:MAG: hypothetical protein VX589_05735 [Myxococcota bacterium]|nr:hypothetical protein [Myxococcota bacterium]
MNQHLNAIGLLAGATLGLALGWWTIQFVDAPMAGNPMVLFGVVGAAVGYVFCRLRYGVSFGHLRQILDQRRLIDDALGEPSSFRSAESATCCLRVPRGGHESTVLKPDTKVDALSQLQSGRDWLAKEPALAGRFAGRLVRFTWSSRPAESFGPADWEPINDLALPEASRATWYGLRMEVLFAQPQLAAFCGLTTIDLAADSPGRAYDVWSDVDDTVSGRFVGPKDTSRFPIFEQFYAISAGFRTTLLDDRWVLDGIGPASSYGFGALTQVVDTLTEAEEDLVDLLVRIDADTGPAFVPVDVLLQRVLNQRRWPAMHAPTNSAFQPGIDTPPVGALAALARRTLRPDQRAELDAWLEAQPLAPDARSAIANVLVEASTQTGDYRPGAAAATGA